jgi:hypothetical protein
MAAIPPIRLSPPTLYATLVLSVTQALSGACSTEVDTLADAKAVLEVVPARVDFGPVEVGTTHTVHVRVFNTGSAPSSQIRPYIAGDTFTVGDDLMLELQPGESMLVPVRFAPPRAGQFRGTLDVEDTIVAGVHAELVGEGTERARDACDGVTCSDPPPCFKAPGVCIQGECRYDEADVGASCAGEANACIRDFRCTADGACRGDAVVCDPVRPPECSTGSMLRRWAPTACDPVIGCDSVYTDVACPNGCVDGSCVDDPCAVITCAPAEACRVGAGCFGGVCEYAPAPGPCDDGNPCTTDTCDATTGVCRGTPIVCDSPPVDRCASSTTFETFASRGVCDGATGVCTYPSSLMACSTPPNAAPTCTAQGCSFACSSGFNLCNGQCRAADDVGACGASCTPCVATAPGAVASCEAGTCVDRCPPGTAMCNGTCAPTPSTPAAGAVTQLAFDGSLACAGTQCGFVPAAPTSFGAGRYCQAAQVDGSTRIIAPGTRFSDMTAAVYVRVAPNLANDTYAIVGSWEDREVFLLAIDVVNGVAYPRAQYHAEVAPDQSLPEVSISRSGTLGLPALPAGSWVHVALTYANSRLQLYVDGVLVGQAVTPTTPVFRFTPVAPILHIGGTPRRWRSFSGQLDHLHIYGRALSDAELLSLR